MLNKVARSSKGVMESRTLPEHVPEVPEERHEESFTTRDLLTAASSGLLVNIDTTGFILFLACGALHKAPLRI